MNTKKLVYASVLIAIGIVLPTITHVTGIPGNIFLPMHIPVFIVGFLLGPLLAGIIGLLLPIVNHLILQMPPVPILYSMIVELFFYGLISGLLYSKTNKILPSLIISMIIGRIVSAIVNYAILGLGNFSLSLWITGSFIKSLPGIIIQIIIIPIIVTAINKKNKA